MMLPNHYCMQILEVIMHFKFLVVPFATFAFFVALDFNTTDKWMHGLLWWLIFWQWSQIPKVVIMLNWPSSEALLWSKWPLLKCWKLVSYSNSFEISKSACSIVHWRPTVMPYLEVEIWGQMVKTTSSGHYEEQSKMLCKAGANMHALWKMAVEFDASDCSCFQWQH